jgi:hypothetical protein
MRRWDTIGEHHAIEFGAGLGIRDDSALSKAILLFPVQSFPLLFMAGK